MVNIIASSSKGNCVIYRETVMVDCGVPFKMVKDHISKLEVLIISHEHGDHINVATINSIKAVKPYVVVCYNETLLDKLKHLKNSIVIKSGYVYDLDIIDLMPISLYHDVPQLGFRIFFYDGVKIFHATDTKHLKGIEAKGYDYYCVESNYDESTIEYMVKVKKDLGLYSHEIGKVNSHLSEQQCVDFFENNKKSSSKLIRLHQ